MAELGVDGGVFSSADAAIALACQWRDVHCHRHRPRHGCQLSITLLNCQSWVNAQPFDNPLTCLGDGHDGVWNIVQQIATADQRREIQGLVSQAWKTSIR